MYWNELKGLKIDRATVDSDGITMWIGGVEIRWNAEGDCCSVSFIDMSSVDGLDALEDAIVLETTPEDNYSVCESEEEFDHEYRKTYFYKLRTDKGYFSVTMYNDSNGYYGGSLECGTNRKRLAAFA